MTKPNLAKYAEKKPALSSKEVVWPALGIQTDGKTHQLSKISDTLLKDPGIRKILKHLVKSLIQLVPGRQVGNEHSC